MPEGPEITITTQYLKTKLKKKKIDSVEVIGGRYLHQTLKGLHLTENTPLTIEDIDSKGKFMWMILKDSVGNSVYMLNTFGMSGRWSFTDSPNARVKMTIKSNTTQNKTYTLYYIDQRNFGTIEFTSDQKDLQKKIDRLAPDALKTDMSDDDLVRMIKEFIKTSKKDKNLVKVLMDQDAIVSGIGNYLVAEILYDAKLNPHRSLTALSDKEIKGLAHSIRKIMKYSYYDNTTGYMEHFKTFMKTHSQRIDDGKFPNYHSDIKPKIGFTFRVYQQKQDPDGNEVVQDEIVKDRTIHWVKEVQK
ncbi:formamidopyrimidine-DNA glycosylase [Yasminevirus sp. GU-2018]|uniref:Formamidopyrimidine-DNA glycosylase n=1 Tax=Yasminevirus sp. GU-2018 TaxID=2420051 RepID=A0A5K0U9R0_9VIRU|nr:formamidopyrimidine-DNA glycosylase [Yasminevirus sp. GU-2018]